MFIGQYCQVGPDPILTVKVLINFGVGQKKFQVRMYISDKTSDNTQMSSSHVTRWGTNKAAQSIVIRDNVWVFS